jgi:hypothetical protein
MTLYTKELGRDGPRRATLSLEWMGAKTKPWFMCKLVELDNGPIALKSVTFWLVQWPDPTPSVEACVSLGRGLRAVCLVKGYAQMLNEAAAVQKIAQWIGPDGKEDWAKIAGVCLGLEQQGLVTR